MKSEKNILIAFILNLAFSIFEFIGGIFTNSVAIISDSIHDIGDAMSIGLSYFLEKKSKKQPDEVYTYGYARYSVIGGVITIFVLIFGSVAVIYNAILRIQNPVEINYDGMIIFAIVNTAIHIISSRENVKYPLVENILSNILYFANMIGTQSCIYLYSKNIYLLTNLLYLFLYAPYNNSY